MTPKFFRGVESRVDHLSATDVVFAGPLTGHGTNTKSAAMQYWQWSYSEQWTKWLRNFVTSICRDHRSTWMSNSRCLHPENISRLPGGARLPQEEKTAFESPLRHRAQPSSTIMPECLVHMRPVVATQITSIMPHRS